MQYNQPYGVTDPDAPYINGNPSTGTMGSIPPAASIEYPQREIVNFETDSGLAPSNSDLRQLSKAVQSGAVNYGPDEGTVNQLEVTLTPTPTLIPGFMVRTLVAVSNTGDSTLNLNALGARRIVRRGGTTLLAADLLGGSMSIFVFDGTNWELYGNNNAAAGGQLHANLDIYVNGAIGNDSNDGTANTAGHALATPQAAVNLAFAYAPSQYNITIHIAAGTYNGSIVTPSYAGPALIISGASAASVLINSGNNASVVITGPNTMTVTGITCQSNGINEGGQHFYAGAGSNLTVSGCASNTTGSGNNAGACFQAYGGNIAVGGHTFNGGTCAACFWANFNGNIGISGVYTFQAPLTMVIGFCWVSAGGSIGINTVTYPTFPGGGNCIGAKFECAGNGTINTTGAGINFFPGTSPGVVTSGGQYN